MTTETTTSAPARQRKARSEQPRESGRAQYLVQVRNTGETWKTVRTFCLPQNARTHADELKNKTVAPWGEVFHAHQFIRVMFRGCEVFNPRTQECAR